MESDRHEAVLRYRQTECEIESLPNATTALQFYFLELSGQAKNLKYEMWKAYFCTYWLKLQWPNLYWWVFLNVYHNIHDLYIRKYT